MTKPYDSLVACIGTGFSGINVGVQLQRWYDESDIVFFDRQDSSGGTWWINTYPGIACDVPAPLYSYSFAQTAEWSSLFPPGREIKAYLDGVKRKYHLDKRMRFSQNVTSCKWDDETSAWILMVEDLKTGTTYYHTSKILFACSGQLLRPNKIDLVGEEKFAGPIFHSARWRKDVDCAGKNVVIIGNGCTAAQIVPNLLHEQNPASITQIVRSKHWILPAPRFEYNNLTRWVLRYIPGALFVLRALIFLAAEMSWPLFYTNRFAEWYRARATLKADRFMRANAPAELHDDLIPDFPLGCKRRIFDPGYLASLHDSRVRLESTRAKEIVTDGLLLNNGDKVKADVIILANGFRTNYFLDGLDVTGAHGRTLQEHWAQFGGAEAYNCSALAGFPNFFIILGPNAATGHTSAIMACENSVNFAMRLLRRVLKGQAKTVVVKPQAETDYVERLQAALRGRVWNTGCNSWYVQANKWNAMSYPYTQMHFWFRSVFPSWSDWQFDMLPSPSQVRH